MGVSKWSSQQLWRIHTLLFACHRRVGLHVLFYRANNFSLRRHNDASVLHFVSISLGNRSCQLFFSIDFEHSVFELPVVFFNIMHSLPPINHTLFSLAAWMSIASEGLSDAF